MNLKDRAKVLYVSMADVSQPNGPGVNEREFLLSLYEGLEERVHAVLPTPRRECDEIESSRTTFYRNPTRWDFMGFLRQQLELYRAVRRLWNTREFDFIVVRLSVVPLAFWCLSRRRLPYAIKTLGAVQGFTKNRGMKGLIARLLGPLNAFLFRGIVARAVAVDCCTETHFKEHLKDYELKRPQLRVVENATNVTRFSPKDQDAAKSALGLEQFQPILGFVGGSPAARGGEQMLEIASRLRDDYPRLGVVIVGDDKNHLLQRRARALNLHDCVVLPGLQLYESIPRYVSSFDIGFALDRPERMVTTGNSYQKVRQYLACGKPVITCVEQDSPLEALGLVESIHPDDLDGLEAATRRLLERNAAEMATHAERARSYVREQLSTQFTFGQRFAFWEQHFSTRTAA